MMRYSRAVLLFLAAFIFQATIVNLFAIFGATPNLVLCLVVIFSFLYDDKNYGVVLGVVFGLLYDICYMQYAGVSALGYLFLGLTVILTRETLNKENIAAILIITAAGTFAFNLFVWGMYALLGSGYGFLYMLKFQPLYVVYNLIVVSILYAVVIRRVIKHRKDRYYI